MIDNEKKLIYSQIKSRDLNISYYIFNITVIN
jgi:hypothetical protein